MNRGILKYMTTQVAIVPIALLFFNGLGNYAHAGTTTANPQATATLSAVCTINARNLSFGNLVLPLSAQSASTSMDVLCSKNASYTVGLAYGGIYGAGSGYNYYVEVGNNAAGTVYYWNEYSPNGTLLGRVNVTETNYNIFPADTNPSNSQVVNGNLQVNSLVGSPAYTYGKMIGVASGDNIAYSIQVPNNPGQIWNTGNNSYSATGTGSSQSIPVVGTLVPAQSGSNYPTPDSYMDTITATVSF